MADDAALERLAVTVEALAKERQELTEQKRLYDIIKSARPHLGRSWTATGALKPEDGIIPYILYFLLPDADSGCVMSYDNEADAERALQKAADFFATFETEIRAAAKLVAPTQSLEELEFIDALYTMKLFIREQKAKTVTP